MKKSIFTLLFLLLYIINSSAQLSPEKAKFEQIGIKNGLSHSTVYTSVQDDKGFLWFGTQDGGLNKFDGYTFTVYRNNPSDNKTIASNNISAILKDNQNNIWIATWGGGLDKLQLTTNQFTHYKSNPMDSTSIGSNKVQTLFLENDSLLWIGTASAGITLFNTKTEKCKHYKHNRSKKNSLVNNRVWNITKDKKTGLIWIATNKGLDAFDQKTNTFTHYKHDKNDPNSLSNNQIRTLMIDKQNRLWVGTASGLNLFIPESNSFKHFYPYTTTQAFSQLNNINTIYLDWKNRMWLGTQTGGLSLFDPETEKFLHFTHHANNPKSISYNDVRSILLDKTGILWISTRGGAINKLNTNTRKFEHYKHNEQNNNSISGNRIYGMSEDSQGNVWIGTDKNGLNKFDPKTDEFTSYFTPESKIKLSSSRIKSVFVDKEDIVWIGTDNGGLNRFDPKTNKIISYQYSPTNPYSISDNEVKVIFEDKSGYLWVGTKNGLNLFSKTKKRFKQYRFEAGSITGISDNRILSIAEDSKGFIWVGTDNGLNKYNKNLQIFITYKNNPTNNSSISNNDIFSILEDSKGNIWVGTGNGINKFDRKNEQFIRFDQISALTGNVIYGILEDSEGNLWLSTLNGLFKFNPNTLEIRNYDTFDGLQSNEFKPTALVKTKAGILYFGGINGFNNFDPLQVFDDPYEAPVIFSSFKIFNEELSIGNDSLEIKHINYTDTITLPYSNYTFSLEFVALNFASPKQNQYRYKMEEIDKNWHNHHNNRYVMYNNLDPGEYTFSVQAANSDGVWNKATSSIHIIITPPFWRRTWFYILATILFISIFVAITKFREYKLRRNTEMLEDKVTQRTLKLKQHKEELETQRDLANYQRKNITDSIKYAKRIQNALFPPNNILEKLFTNHLVLNIPKEIVSGDFYWIAKKGNQIVIAVADSTGHGVPGAFMSILGITMLNHSITKSEKITANEILNTLRESIIKVLHQKMERREAQDGIDIALCTIDTENMVLEYAGAYNPILLFRKEDDEYQITEYKADRMPIGIYKGKNKPFTSQKISLQKGDRIFMFSDGYQDQFGGKNGRKFLATRFKKLLLNIQNKDMIQQRITLENTFYSWKKDIMQIDDILIIGIEI